MLNLDFSNTEIAFKAKSDSELRATKFLFKVMGNPRLVKMGKHMSNLAMSINFPINWAVKPTLYRHFVGGETIEDCVKCIDNLAKYGIKSTLDYSSEGASDPTSIEKTLNETLRAIEYASKNSNVAYAVFKPTAITYFAVLEKKSMGYEMCAEDDKEFEMFCNRMDTLAKKAHSLGVRLLVDAEHYATQKAIDDVVNSLMPIYNKSRAIVFNTLQMYRHDRYAHLVEEHGKATEQGYFYGVKFVRGAYMDAERAMAKAKGYEDPICRDKAATDENYDKGLEYVIENIENIEVFSGTHNEKSNMLLAELMTKKGLSPNDERIYFAQLYGMSDNISYSLADAGFNITKYVPYGPVKEVLPYLIRRAEENTMVKGQTLRELSLIKTEWSRRHKPTCSFG